MDNVSINPPGPTFPAFSQAVQSGPWLTVSGQVPVKDGALISDDPLVQAQQCFENLQSVLAAAGFGFEDIVKLTCFLTDASAYPAYVKVKQEWLGAAAPAGTGVIVSGLLIPGAWMEVEAVAWKESAQ